MRSRFFTVAAVAAATTSMTGGSASVDPPVRLSQTGLYQNIQYKLLNEGVIAYSPQYPLWSDGAHKQRWIELPGVTRIRVDPGSGNWIFPVGTKFWKEFALPRDPRDPSSPWHRIETRLMTKVNAERWEFATYLWDDAEMDATLAPRAGVPNHWPLPENRKYRIPAEVSCRVCHGTLGERVLGFNALQLSSDRESEGLTVSNLIQMGKIDLATDRPVALRLDPRVPTMRQAWGYFQGNCVSCHRPDGDAAATGLYFHHLEGEPALERQPYFQTVVSRRTAAFRIPGQSASFEILPGNPAQSAILYRLAHPGGEAQMPPGWAVSWGNPSVIPWMERFINELAQLNN